MKYNIKQSSLLMLFALFLVTFCFIACDDQDNEEQEQVGQLTPEALCQILFLLFFYPVLLEWLL